ncbi:MAG: hypothetical protein HQM08_07735 [Candidatus Riflebacteria bacterium]|nr:hypothetical protein [Candidatus Riflebacteria bacterium]
MVNTEAKDRIIHESGFENGKKRLPCPCAFNISQELNISLKEIGEICESLGIKISSCQLGCF